MIKGGIVKAGKVNPSMMRGGKDLVLKVLEVVRLETMEPNI